MKNSGSFKTDSEWLGSIKGRPQTVENWGFAPLNPSHPFRFNGFETACSLLFGSLCVWAVKSKPRTEIAKA